MRLGISLIAAAIALPITAWADPPVLPDPDLTPGVVASTDQAEVCGIVGGLSYSKRHRVTPSEMKAEVRQRYFQKYGTYKVGEIDHRGPLALGFADAVENLWPQPPPPEPWNFHLKDKLETRVWEMTCHEGKMSLADAQAIFLAPDWRVGYCQIIGGAPCPP